MPIEKRWVVKPQGNPEAVAAMAAATGISPVLANLLVQRGIDTLEKAKKFFNPQLSDLHDPFLMILSSSTENGSYFFIPLFMMLKNTYVRRTF